MDSKRRSIERLTAQIEEMFAIREVTPAHPSWGTTYEGYLLLPQDRSINVYGAICLRVLGYVFNGAAFVTIGSIDDSSCTIWGPVGTTIEDVKRIIAFLRCYGVTCPSREDLNAWCRSEGFYADYN